jgi:hypothetical protein
VSRYILPTRAEVNEATSALNALSLTGELEFPGANNFRQLVARRAAEIVDRGLLAFMNFTYDRPEPDRRRCPRFYQYSLGIFEESL